VNLSRRSWLVAAAGSLFAADPVHRDMIVRSKRPEDFEMPFSGFQHYLTPADLLFVRHHHYAADVDMSTWKLSVGGLVEKPFTLTFEQLRRMPRLEHIAVMECAGNGRGNFEPGVPGLQWRSGAVGNLQWAGVRLADVLHMAGLKDGSKHVLFDGADEPMGTMPKFQRTLPVAKAMHPDTMLAYEMNGAPLPRLHGFPLRVVAPGWASDGWPKWLRQITVLDKEFEGFFEATAYRHPGAAVAPGSAVDPKLMRPVEKLRVKSVIGAPLDGATVAPGAVTITGAAWTGEAQVVSVAVSIDAGRTWKVADLGHDTSKYGWRLWEYHAELTPGYYNILARAFDSSGDAQPLTQEWNPSGYLWNVTPQIGLRVAEGATTAPVVVQAEAVQPPAPVKASCLPCHGVEVITQQRLNRPQWEREVDKMVRWGAQVPADDRATILEFLSRFGPRPIR